eukprot:PLAT5425.1.p1 GENE.PLAT5425.1~~PLAT5425.1.p1  ORF type:complete len:361 (-),score=187.58 PLAT5425.1:34-1116(-)
MDIDWLSVGWSAFAWGGLALSLCYILPLLASRFGTAMRSSLGWTLLLLGLTAWYATWSKMVQLAAEDKAGSACGEADGMLCWFTRRHPEHPEYPLFFYAYRRVSDTPTRWFVSQQLLTLVLSTSCWIVALCARARLSRGVAAAFIWLGFTMAISLGTAVLLLVLLFTADSLPRKVGPGYRPQLWQPLPACMPAPLALLGALLLSAASVVAIPATSGVLFNVALAGGHLLLLAPALLPVAKTEAQSLRSYQLALAASAATALAVQIVSAAGMAASMPSSLAAWPAAIVAACATPAAQASISWDVFFSSLLLAVYMLTRRGRRGAALLACAALPLLGIGVVFPLFLLAGELAGESRAREKAV